MYALAMGEENQDDLDRLAHDPALRMAAWDRPGQGVLEERLASQPTQSRLLAWLAKAPQNRERCGTRCSIDPGQHPVEHAVPEVGPLNRATVDIDSFAVRVHGDNMPPVTTATCVRSSTIRRWPASPLKETTTARCVAIGSATASSTPRCGKARCTPRKGRDVSCDAWWSMSPDGEELLDLRLDAGFTIGAVLDELSDQKVRFCGRLRKNPVLDRLVEPHLQRPPGRPPLAAVMRKSSNSEAIAPKVGSTRSG